MKRISSMSFALSGAVFCIGIATANEPYQEYNKRIQASQTLTALTDEFMGDSVSLYNGATEFTAVDIDLPGNNALPVKLARHWSIEILPVGAPGGGPDPHLLGVGNWDVDVPHVSGTYLSGTSWNAQRCSAFVMPVASGFQSTEFWHGNAVHIPGAGDKSMLQIESQTPKPTDGVQRIWTTRDRDMISCIPMKSGLPGEGFLLQTTSGLRYYFDTAVARPIGNMDRTIDGIVTSVARTKFYILASKITDRFGNSVDLLYNSLGNPTSIVANDGRSITLTYTNGRLSTATANTAQGSQRTWSYTYYTGQQDGMLKSVVLPDTSSWQYAYTGTLFPFYQAWDGGSNETCSVKAPPITADFGLTITHPSGAIGSFQFSNKRQPRSGVHLSECLRRQTRENQIYYILNTPNYFDVMAITSKSLTGVGIPQARTWAYTFPGGTVALWGTNGQAAPYPCTTCPSEKLVTVVRQDQTKEVYRYGYLYTVNDGRLLGKTQYDEAGAVKRVEAADYLSDSDAPNQNFFDRYGLIINGDDRTTAAVRPVIRQSIVQDGTKFLMEVQKGCTSAAAYCFDTFGNPTKTIKQSTPQP